MPVVGVLLPRRTHLSRTFFMSYSDKLKHPKWQKKRLEILNRDSWACKYCSDTESQLHVHHLKYTTKEPYDELSENLVATCQDCHRLLEAIKLSTYNNYSSIILIEKGKEMMVAYSADWIYVFKIDTMLLIIAMASGALQGIIKTHNKLF